MLILLLRCVEPAREGLHVLGLVGAALQDGIAAQQGRRGGKFERGAAAAAFRHDAQGHSHRARAGKMDYISGLLRFLNLIVAITSMLQWINSFHINKLRERIKHKYSTNPQIFYEGRYIDPRLLYQVGHPFAAFRQSVSETDRCLCALRVR